MDRLILNCDLGEDEPLEQTEQLLSLVDAANIGCGFHAGSAEKTRATLQLAIKYGVRIGAHPGISTDGGRGEARPSPVDFRELLESQFGAFRETASSLGAHVEYLKLHGSLYHAVESQIEMADVTIGFLRRQRPKLSVFALAGGVFARRAEAAGITVYHEAFADRNYQSDGSLVPRTEKGAVLSEKEALARLLVWRETGEMPSRGGQTIDFEANTLCVHGDSPGAVNMIRKIRLLI